MIDINLHTHTYRCHHGSGTDRQMIEAAINAGYKEIGFSEHVPLLFENGKQTAHRMFVEDAPLYMKSLRELREEYAGKIKIHIGFEVEYYEKYFDQVIDYVRSLGAEYLLLGQHYVYAEVNGGNHVFRPTDNETELRDYVKAILDGAKSGLFTYVAHPDGLHYVGPDDIYEKYMRELIEGIMETGLPMELNRTGYYEPRNYPDKRFWRLANEMHADAVIGLDAHSPEAYQDVETVKGMENYLKELGNIRLVTPKVNFI